MKKNLLAMQAAIVGQLVLTRKLVLTAFFFCGASVLTSCTNQIDNPAPSPTLPKSYNLVADEYKEAILDDMIWTNIANTPQDQGETFTIESPKPGAQLTIHYCREP